MNWILFADNIISIGLSIILWFMVHESMNSESRFSKILGVGWGILGLLVFANMLFRNVDSYAPFLLFSLVTSKAILGLCLAGVAWRTHYRMQI